MKLSKLVNGDPPSFPETDRFALDGSRHVELLN
jgi:hypothetical protein